MNGREADAGASAATADPDVADAVEEAPGPYLVAYPLTSLPRMELVPAATGRDWIDATPAKFARRCLPLLMANQVGWFVLNSHAFDAAWDGGVGQNALTIAYRSGSAPYPAVSHFGSGILTFHVPYLFRTPPGIHLLARGPSNWPRDGIAPLEGLVETDWSVASFTMNWKFTRPGAAVSFEEDEPICMLVPVRTGLLEAVRPEVRPLAADPATRDGHAAWTAARSRFLVELRTPGSEAQDAGWQKDYFRGQRPDGTKAPAHRTTLRLRPFDDPRPRPSRKTGAERRAERRDERRRQRAAADPNGTCPAPADGVSPA